MNELQKNEGNHNFIKRVEEILSKYSWSDDKAQAEGEITVAQKEFNVTSGQVTREVKQMVADHFNVSTNGHVIDILLHEVAQNDLGKLKEQFNLEDSTFNRIRNSAEAEHSNWEQTLRVPLEEGKSLNLANDKVVEALVGLSVWQLQGHKVNLPNVNEQTKQHS